MVNTSKGKAIWDKEYIDIFCQLCLKEIDVGHRPGTHFERKGWHNLIQNFAKATGREYNKQQLKNKWDNLKDYWKLWKQLKGSETGLGWDPKKKTIDASDDWWAKRIEINQEYKKFRTKGIDPDYEDTLDRMFSDVVATGKYEFAPSSGSLSINDLEMNISEDIQTDSDMDSDDDVILATNQKFDDISDGMSNLKRKKKSPKRKVQKKSRNHGGREKVGGAQKMAQQIERLCTAVETRRTPSIVNANKSVVTISEAMEQLDAIPGIELDSEAYLCATRLFMNKDKREMFACLKTHELKFAWLKNEQSLGL